MRRFRLAPRGGQNGTRPGFRAIQHGECALGALEDRFCLPGRCVRIGCREIYNDNFPGRYAPEPCKWCKKAQFFPALRAGRPTTRCFYTYSICVYSPVLQPGLCSREELACGPEPLELLSTGAERMTQWRGGSLPPPSHLLPSRPSMESETVAGP